jgi:hypothetical protein
VFGHPERREGPLSPSLDKRQVNRCAQDAEERAQANAVHGVQRPLARLAGIGVSAETARDFAITHYDTQTGARTHMMLLARDTL